MDTAQPVGTGGGLPYITETPAASTVNQEQPHSCQAACARQILRDVGIDISEADLLEEIGYLEGWGTVASKTAKALDALHPTQGYAGGPVDPEAAAQLFQRTPWIASLRTHRGTIHAVIVDRLEGEIVHLRDPWGAFGPGSGQGTRATIGLKDFMEHWHWALNTAVFSNRMK